MSENEQWYSNKDLFEQINKLSNEMQETRNLIKQYNGLREKVDKVESNVKNVEDTMKTIQAEKKGKSKVFTAIREWGGWIIALISLVILLKNQF